MAQSLWFMTQDRHLEMDGFTWNPAQFRANIDHVVELQIIVDYFTREYDQAFDVPIPINQWNAVRDFVGSDGKRPRGSTNDNSVSNADACRRREMYQTHLNQCRAFGDFAAYVGGGPNLRAIAPEINNLKNVLVRKNTQVLHLSCLLYGHLE